MLSNYCMWLPLDKVGQHIEKLKLTFLGMHIAGSRNHIYALQDTRKAVVLEVLYSYTLYLISIFLPNVTVHSEYT